jgi:CheY-like chemotaxis protein
MRPSLRGLPVMIVEDDVLSAKLLAIVLRSEGCEVRIAGSAEAALEVMPSFRPRVIVLDLVLPAMSGLLFAELLRADPATRDVIIVAVTAFNGSEVERAVLEAGCVDYVRKPIDPLTFADRLRNVLRGTT